MGRPPWNPMHDESQPAQGASQQSTKPGPQKQVAHQRGRGSRGKIVCGIPELPAFGRVCRRISDQTGMMQQMPIHPRPSSASLNRARASHIPTPLGRGTLLPSKIRDATGAQHRPVLSQIHDKPQGPRKASKYDSLKHGALVHQELLFRLWVQVDAFYLGIGMGSLACLNEYAAAAKASVKCGARPPANRPPTPLAGVDKKCRA